MGPLISSSQRMGFPGSIADTTELKTSVEGQEGGRAGNAACVQGQRGNLTVCAWRNDLQMNTVEEKSPPQRSFQVSVNIPPLTRDARPPQPLFFLRWRGG